MNENQTTQLVCVAAIAGAFGVKGEVKLKSFTDDPMACVRYGPLQNEKGDVVLTIKNARKVKTMLAVRAPEVTTREQAESLKSTKLYIPRTALPSAEPDEFYYADLIGLKVMTVEGENYGRIKAVHDFGGGDILEIQMPGQKDWYHPFTKEAVPVIDISKGHIVIEITETDDDADDSRNS